MSNNKDIVLGGILCLHNFKSRSIQWAAVSLTLVGTMEYAVSQFCPEEAYNLAN